MRDLEHDYPIGCVRWWCEKHKAKDDRSLVSFEVSVGRVHGLLLPSSPNGKKRLTFLAGNGEYEIPVPETKTFTSLFDLACFTKMPKLVYTQFYERFKPLFVPTTDKMLDRNIARSAIVVDSRIAGRMTTTVDDSEEIPEYVRYSF